MVLRDASASKNYKQTNSQARQSPVLHKRHLGWKKKPLWGDKWLRFSRKNCFQVILSFFGGFLLSHLNVPCYVTVTLRNRGPGPDVFEVWWTSLKFLKSRIARCIHVDLINSIFPKECDEPPEPPFQLVWSDTFCLDWRVSWWFRGEIRKCISQICIVHCL